MDGMKPSSSKGRETLKLALAGTVIILVLYLGIWYVLKKDTVESPVYQFNLLMNQLSGKAAEDIDAITDPPHLPTMADRLPDELKERFKTAVNLLCKQKRYKRAGRMLWPIAAEHPVIRPSIAAEYRKAAELEDDPAKALQLAWMAYEFYSTGYRENELLAELHECLGHAREAAHFRNRAEFFRETLKKRLVQPPPPAVTVVIGILMLLIVGTAYFYWNKLGVVELLGAGGRGGAGQDMPQIGEVTHVTRLTPQEEGSITSILTAESYLQDIQRMFEQKEYEKAVDLCQKAVDLNSANSAKVSQLCLQEGVSLYELGDLNQAIDVLEVALHFNPHNVQAHLCLGNCYIKLQQYDKAQYHYEQVISITPQNGDAYYTLGVCYQKTNDLPRAKRSFEVAVKLKNHPNAHFYLAKICEMEKDLECAILHWEKFIELAPEHPQAPLAAKRLEALKKLVAQQEGE